MKVFISGSISIKSLKDDITVIEQIVEAGDTILIGDAFGVDRAVQQYLAEQNYRSVIVYFSGEKLRNNIGNWQTKQIPNPENLTGRNQYQLKDKAMADDCDSAVMFWDCKSKGTKQNMEYMDDIGKHYRVSVADSVDEIDSVDFLSCFKFNSIHIPCSVSLIDDFIIKRCRHITIHPDNPIYTIKNGKVAFKKIEPTSGRVGKLDWTFSNRVLTIKSNGKLSDFEDFEKGYSKKSKLSWYPFRAQIKKIVFKGNYPWECCRTRSSVTFEDWSVPAFDEGSLSVRGIINKAFKGYISSDLWALDHWFSVQFPRMLKDLKKEQKGHPGHLTSEEWNKILDRMAFCLSEMVAPHYAIEDEKMYAYRDEMKNEGFELLCKYFRDLWW